MPIAAAALDGILNLRNVFLALALAALVLFSFYTMAKNRGALGKGRSNDLFYEVPGKNAAACRAALGTRAQEDLFAYRLDAAANGGWRITFTRHVPTDQILDTTYLLQFAGDDPARIWLKFLGEAFGQRESVIPAALLDAFFAAKLAAVPVDPFDGAPDDTPNGSAT